MALDETVRWMNTEVTFFVRTFSFVYLGPILGLGAAERVPQAAVLLGAVMAAHAAAVALLVRLQPSERQDEDALVVMVPRGLATAVPAATPLAFGVAGSELLVALASVLTVLSNLAATVGLVALHDASPGTRRPRDRGPSPRRPHAKGQRISRSGAYATAWPWTWPSTSRSS